MRVAAFMAFILMLTIGCSHANVNPVAPDNNPQGNNISGLTANSESIGQYMLWGRWNFYIDETHEKVEAVPVRSGDVHLNVTKILETYCSDCLKIMKIEKNSDNTIDLTLRITHPYPNVPDYTGFDVKGIIMFTGSHLMEWGGTYTFPQDNPLRLSWRMMGDPEVLNADGFTPRWCPEWPTDSDMPIFNYWPGKYSNGTPTANINAFLNFYTDEERHIFRVNGQVNRTYHIWLPPGKITAGYAIEAHWDAPTITPVTDPLNDFPITANQWDAYKFKYVINNNEPITTEPCCGNYESCETGYMEVLYWQGEKPRNFQGAFDYFPGLGSIGAQYCPIDKPPFNDGFLCSYPNHLITTYFPNGTFQGAGIIYRFTDPAHYYPIAWDVYEFVVDLPD